MPYMTAEEQQAAYRKSCTVRRNRHVIEELDGDEWKPVYTGEAVIRGEKTVSINDAKREIRRRGERSYTVQ